MASSARVYGALLDPVYGELRPVPADRILAAEDGQTLDLGGRRLEILHAPGHARHHVGVFEPDGGLLFAGDGVGVSTPASPELRPAVPSARLRPGAAVREPPPVRRAPPGAADPEPLRADRPAAGAAGRGGGDDPPLVRDRRAGRRRARQRDRPHRGRPPRALRRRARQRGHAGGRAAQRLPLQRRGPVPLDRREAARRRGLTPAARRLSRQARSVAPSSRSITIGSSSDSSRPPAGRQLGCRIGDRGRGLVPVVGRVDGLLVGGCRGACLRPVSPLSVRPCVRGLVEADDGGVAVAVCLRIVGAGSPGVSAGVVRDCPGQLGVDGVVRLRCPLRSPAS